MEGSMKCSFSDEDLRTIAITGHGIGRSFAAAIVLSRPSMGLTDDERLGFTACFDKGIRELRVRLGLE